MNLFRLLTLLAVFAFSTSPTQAAVVSNGDFSSDLAGWTVTASDFFNTIDAAPFVSVQSDSGNNYLELSTGLLVQGLFVLTVEQEVTVTAQSALMGVDVRSFAPVNDVSDSGNSNITDGLFINIVTSDGSITNAGFADDRGPFLGDLGLALVPPVNDFFDFRLITDLSAFVGQTITIQLSVSPSLDGFVSSFGLDNIDMTPIPVPPAIWLFVTALSVLGVSRNTR